jgi:hypothetical protein
MGGYFRGEGLEGFASGFDEGVCDGWLLYCGEGDKDDFGTLKLQASVSA